MLIVGEISFWFRFLSNEIKRLRNAHSGKCLNFKGGFYTFTDSTKKFNPLGFFCIIVFLILNLLSGIVSNGANRLLTDVELLMNKFSCKKERKRYFPFRVKLRSCKLRQKLYRSNKKSH
jgi:hypothetical protein